MKGSVSWTAKGYESGGGEVTSCSQDKAKLNVGFTCDDVGVGQITLSISTAEQFASARFYYEGEQEPTYAGVSGKLTRQLDAWQFEGHWDDQDYDTIWWFSIRVKGFDFAPDTVDVEEALAPSMNSLKEIVSTLDRRYLSAWFDDEESPERPGIYRVKPNFWNSRRLAYAAWDGTSWSGARETIEQLDSLVPQEHGAHGWRPWRGLTEEGSRHVSLLLEDLQRRELECSNRILLASLRQAELKLVRARAAARDEYWGWVARINGSDETETARQAMRRDLDRLVGTDFDVPTEIAFDESTPRTVEGARTEMLVALEAAAARARYWNDYWSVTALKYFPSGAGPVSGRLVVGYGKDMKARLGKGASMMPLQGSYGTKPRK